MRLCASSAVCLRQNARRCCTEWTQAATPRVTSSLSTTMRMLLLRWLCCLPMARGAARLHVVRSPVRIVFAARAVIFRRH